MTLIIGVILAFRTRKVTIKALNDSKYLSIIIYISAVILMVMIPGVIFLNKFLNIDAAVFGGILLLFTTVVLGLTFIPKVCYLDLSCNMQQDNCPSPSKRKYKSRYPFY